jgi:hypothetical protein
MKKTEKAEPQKKGLFAILKESMLKTSEGCGPGCGCNAEEERTREKGDNDTPDDSKK